MNKKLWLGALGVALCAESAIAGTGFPEAAFTETTFASGLTCATSMAWAPDGSNRLFVTRQGTCLSGSSNIPLGGQVRIIKDGTLLPDPFVNVAPGYYSSEAGLLGIAFDPNFATNGYVYVFSTVSATEQQIIRYTAVGDTGTDKTVIVSGLPTVGDTHNGGGLSVGPDAKLYWGIGDNRINDGTVTDDTTYLRSKISRANLDGSSPGDNPFDDGAGPNHELIWARGFRNPFTHTWHPRTKKLWVNDVGGFGEQVFQVNRGEHGGWDTYGGGNQPTGFIRPVFMVEAGGASGAAITGGTFYDGTLFPAPYRDNYFLGDFEVPGRIIRATFDTNDAFQGQSVFGTDIPYIVDIEVGPDGALYYAEYMSGRVMRLGYTSTAQNIVIGRRNLDLVECGSAVASVSLAVAPSSDVTVTIARESGDGDLGISSGATLTFTPANYAVPQSVVIAAAGDADTTDDNASFTVTSDGLTGHTIAAHAADVQGTCAPAVGDPPGSGGGGGGGGGGEDSGCCRTSPASPGWLLLVGLVGVGVLRRRRARA